MSGGCSSWKWLCGRFSEGQVCDCERGVKMTYRSGGLCCHLPQTPCQKVAGLIFVSCRDWSWVLNWIQVDSAGFKNNAWKEVNAEELDTVSSCWMDVSLQIWVLKGRVEAMQTGWQKWQDQACYRRKKLQICVRRDQKKNLFCGQRCKQPSKIGSSPSSQRWVWRATPMLVFRKVRCHASGRLLPPHHKLQNWLWFSQSHGWIPLKLAWLSACFTPWPQRGVICIFRKLQPRLPSQVCCCDCEWGQKVFSFPGD